MAYITVDIELYNLSDWELLEEISTRHLSDRQVIGLVKANAGEDMRKLQLFMECKDRFSLIELQELFEEDLPSTVNPSSQLRLAI